MRLLCVEQIIWKLVASFPKHMPNCSSEIFVFCHLLIRRSFTQRGCSFICLSCGRPLAILFAPQARRRVSAAANGRPSCSLLEKAHCSLLATTKVWQLVVFLLLLLWLLLLLLLLLPLMLLLLLPILEKEAIKVGRKGGGGGAARA